MILRERLYGFYNTQHIHIDILYKYCDVANTNTFSNIEI